VKCGDDEKRTIYPADDQYMIVCGRCGFEGSWGNDLKEAVRRWNVVNEVELDDD
jgi:hypothetical protein